MAYGYLPNSALVCGAALLEVWDSDSIVGWGFRVFFQVLERLLEA